jgi:hypothetical protein
MSTRAGLVSRKAGRALGRPRRTAFIVWICALALMPMGCLGAGEPDSTLSEDEDDHSQLSGRGFAIRISDGTGSFETVRVTVDSEDVLWNTFNDSMNLTCRLSVNQEFGGLAGPGINICATNGAGVPYGAMWQRIVLCEGHLLRQIVDSHVPVDFVSDGTGQVTAQFRDGTQPPPLAACASSSSFNCTRATIPAVTDPDDAVTYAALATRAFQRAALAGAHMMSDMCPDGSLTGTISSTPPQSVAEFVADSTQEATLAMVQSAALSVEGVRTAALTRSDDERNGFRHADMLFRDSDGDSLLRAASFLAPVPSQLFTTAADVDLRAGDSRYDINHRRFPAPLASPPRPGTGASVAQGLLNRFGVDTRRWTPANVVAALRRAMRLERPELYDTAFAQAFDDARFFSYYASVSLTEIREGYLAMVASPWMFGLPMAVDTLRPGYSPGDPQTYRVRGSQLPSGPASTAYLSAITYGSYSGSRPAGPQHSIGQDALNYQFEGTPNAAPPAELTTLTGTGAWRLDSARNHTIGGATSVRSGPIGDGGTSDMSIAVDLPSAGYVDFWYSIDSEANWDFLRVLVDGVQVGSWSGAGAWAHANFPLTAGAHTLTFRYAKDGSGSIGLDRAWIDDLYITATGGAFLPDPGWDGLGTPMYGDTHVLETLDVVATAAALALDRRDTAGGETREILELTRHYGRGFVPTRLEVSVGDGGVAPLVAAVPSITGPTTCRQPRALRLRVYRTQNLSATYRIYVNEDGLECGLTGQIGSTPCVADQYRLTSTATLQTGGFRSGMGTQFIEFAAGGSLTRAADPPDPEVGLAVTDCDRLYVVATSSAQPPEVVGAFRATLGPAGTLADSFLNRRTLILGTSGGATPIDDSLPPEAHEGSQWLATVLAASPHDPAEAAGFCHGFPSPQPVYGEDETVIASGANPNDSFDLTFQVLAERASFDAERADEMGRQIIELGLAMDTQAAQGSARLEELCGDVGDISTLPIIPTATPCTSTCSTPNFTCIDGFCRPAGYADALANATSGTDPTAVRLASCIGAAGTRSIVTPGSQARCVWRADANGDGFADSGSVPCATQVGTLNFPAGTQCPFSGDCTVGTIATLLPAGTSVTGVVAVPVEALGIVDGTVTSTGAGQCQAFAEFLARQPPPTGVTRADRLHQILASDWIREANVQSMALQMGWQQGPLGLSSMSIEGIPWGSLGSLASGTSDVWPCVGTAIPSLAAAACSSIPVGTVRPIACAQSCSSVTARRDTSVRFVTALTALQRSVGVRPRIAGAYTPSDMLGYGLYTRPGTTPGSAGWGETILFGSLLAASLQADTSVCTSLHAVDSSVPTSNCLAGAAIATVTLPGEDAVYERLAPAGGWYNTFDEYITPSSLPPVYLNGGAHYTHPWQTSVGIAMALGGPPIEARLHDAQHETEYRDEVTELWRPGGGIQDILEWYDASAGHSASEIIGHLVDAPEGGHYVSATTTGAHARFCDPTSDGCVGGALMVPGWPNYMYWVGQCGLGDFAMGEEPVYPADDECMAAQVEDLLQGLMLACLAEERSGGNAGCSTALTTVPTVNGPGDLEALGARLECSGRRVESVMADFIMTDVPSRFVPELQTGANSVGEISPELGGQHAAQVAQLRGQLQELVGHAHATRRALARFAEVIDTLKISLDVSDIHRRQSSIQMMATIANQVTACGTAIASIPGLDPVSMGGKAASAAITCVNTVLQSIAAADLNDLANEIEDDTEQSIYLQSVINFVDAQGELDTHVQQAIELYAQIQGTLAAIQATTLAASRAFAEARLSTTDAHGHTLHSNLVMHRRLSTVVSEYERRLQQARRSAYVLRASVESHYATSVDEPWADDLCWLSGIDYEAIRSDAAGSPDDYSGEFIGTYVDRLRHWVQQYSEDHPTMPARDTAILSMRDDLLDVRESCRVASANLLLGSADPTDAAAGWAMMLPSGGQVGSTVALASPNGVTLDRECSPATCSSYSMAPAAPLVQSIYLVPGTYILSWLERNGSAGGYGSTPATCAAAAPLSAVLVPYAAGSAATVGLGSIQTPATGQWTPDPCRYRRSYVQLTVSVPQTVSVGFGLKGGVASVGFSSPQLERLPAGSASGTSAGGYEATDFAGTTLSDGNCPDLDGSTFRSEHWSYGCTQVCSTGISASCLDGVEACYHETTIDIGQGIIDAGRVGIAPGSFNYRVDTLALNVVGLGVIDCGSGTEPDCYTSALVPMSIYHLGGHVRNHLGEMVDVHRVPGRIEYGEALAAERQLTDPVVEPLIGELRHSEMRGQPLVGSYTVRLWETPELAWSHVEDVQIELGYTYWTPQR